MLRNDCHDHQFTSYKQLTAGSSYLICAFNAHYLMVFVAGEIDVLGYQHSLLTHYAIMKNINLSLFLSTTKINHNFYFRK